MSTDLKFASLDVHREGVELHGTDERDPGGKGVHQVVLVIDPDALLDGKSVIANKDRDQCDQIGLF